MPAPTSAIPSSRPIAGDDEDATEGGNTYAWLPAAGYNPDTSGWDLHGAGSVVFDTKAEEVSDGTDFEVIYHHVRLVRDGGVTETPDGGGGEGGPDLAAVAEELGVSEEDLVAALGEPGTRPRDLAVAAEALGVTAEEVEAALGDSGGAPPAEDGG